MPEDEGPRASHPAPSNSLLELIDRLREEFPDLSPHAVVRCVSIVAHHPSSSALNADALLRHTERIARARLIHLNELPGKPVAASPDHPDGPPIARQARSRPRSASCFDLNLNVGA
jgi:hypothetical protein